MRRLFSLDNLVNLVRSVLLDSWRFIVKPFTPAAVAEEFRNLRAAKPASFKKGMLELIPKLTIYYLLLSPIVAMPLYNTMIFHPFATGNYDLKAIDGVPCQNVFFPSTNGKRLYAWFFSCPGASKTVLVSHGNAGNLTNREGLVRLVLQAGASVLVFDYQGFGKSEGHPSLAGICEDTAAAYQYLVQDKRVSPANVIIMGESIGTGAACVVGLSHPCAGIVLQSAYTSLPSLVREKLPLMCLYPDWLFPPTRLDTLAALKRTHPPLLLVHGAQDTLIPIKHSQLIYEQALAPKSFTSLPDAGHNDIYDVDSSQYIGALKQFIDSLS